MSHSKIDIDDDIAMGWLDKCPTSIYLLSNCTLRTCLSVELHIMCLVRTFASGVRCLAHIRSL